MHRWVGSGEGAGYYRFPEVDSVGDAEARPSERWDVLVRPGDLLLVRTPGLLLSAGRRLMGNLFDQVAVVLEDGMTLNIVNPEPAVIPLEAFARRGTPPLVVRPTWVDERQRDDFLSRMDAYRSASYDLSKTLKGIVSTALYRWLGVRIAMRKPDAAAPGGSAPRP